MHLDEKRETKEVESFADRLPYSGLDAGSRKLNSSLCPNAITTSDHSLITCRAHWDTFTRNVHDMMETTKTQPGNAHKIAEVLR